MILLVDDNQVQLGTRRVILERAGYNVQAAESGLQGLGLLKPHCEKVRLVITDHMMPGMNGVEFVTEVRKTCPDIPVLVISGLPDAQDDYGNLDVSIAIKPFPPDDLIATVKELVNTPLTRTA